MTDYAGSMRITQTRKPLSLERCTYYGALGASGVAIAYLLTVYAGSEVGSSDLTLSMIQCLLGIAALHVPLALKRWVRIELPDALSAAYYTFIVGATVLGEVCAIYYLIPFWDDILHLSSGAMCGMLGGIITVTFLQRKDCEKLLSPMLASVVAVGFAMCIGVFWEVYEFLGDSLMGLNMQKFLLQDGEALVGQAALVDTMKDLIVDTLGAVIAAVSAYRSLKYESGWLHSYQATSQRGRIQCGRHPGRHEKEVLQQSA